jgi:hypothetical protein
MQDMRWSGGFGPWTALFGLILALGACCQSLEVDMQAQPNPVPLSGVAQISLRVRYPPAGALYRWRAERGACEPQESHRVSTTYTAPREPGDDRVTLELLSEGRIVYTKDLKITVSGAPQGAPGKKPPPLPAGPGQAAIRITLIPRYNPQGGPMTRDDIAGEVSGVDANNHRVVIYACTDMCYVQPLDTAPFTPIHPDDTWTTWTHTGAHYLALVVPAGWQPSPTVASPDAPIDGAVARTVVEGRR